MGWEFNGAYWDIDKCEIDYKSQQMTVSYIGYKNREKLEPIASKMYITKIREFKNKQDLEDLIFDNQKREELK